MYLIFYPSAKENFLNSLNYRTVIAFRIWLFKKFCYF